MEINQNFNMTFLYLNPNINFNNQGKFTCNKSKCNRTNFNLK